MEVLGERLNLNSAVYLGSSCVCSDKCYYIECVAYRYIKTINNG